MFIIDATFEDMRIQATALDEGRVGTDWQVTFTDNHKGGSKIEVLTPEQLTMVLAFNLHPEGEPEGFKQMYEVLEPIFKDYPINLRPIP